MLQRYLICKKRLQIHFQTTKYPYGFRDRLFNLFFTISFACFYHGSQYLAITVVISRHLIPRLTEISAVFLFSFRKTWGYHTSSRLWFVNFKRSFVWSFKSSTRVIKWRRFANVTAVWNWWNKPICTCFFKMFFIKNVSLKRFYKYKNCCNRPQFLNKETVMKCFGVKIFAWNFLQLPIQNMYLKLYA